MLTHFFRVTALVLLVVFSARSQNLAQDYLFNRTSEPYIALENDTTLGTGFQDDILYMSQSNHTASNCISCSLTGTGFPIGFPFVFDGNTFTRWAFSSNGYIKLGTETPFTITNSLSTSMSSTDPTQVNLISALHGDIMMTEIQGSFRYRTIGAPGSRMLVVEYRAMKHYVPTVTSEEIYNFQIRLHEGTNRISFVYGTFLKDEVNRTYTVGIKGGNSSNFHVRSLPSSAASWNDNTRGTSLSSTMSMNINLLPGFGTVYNFIPRQYDNDLGLEEILAPLQGIKSCEMGNAEQVTVKIKNSGLLPQTSASIGYLVGTNAPVIQNVTLSPQLAANETRTFTFNTPADLSGFLPPNLRCFVFLPSEEIGARSNDTLSLAFTIGRPFETNLISSYDSLLLKGWKTGRGSNTPGASTYSLWKNSQSFGFNSSVLEMRTDTPLVKNEWLYSPGYKVDTAFNYAIAFQAAITDGLTGTNPPAAGIGDDTIQLLYSTDCRNTWKLLKSFSNADLTSGDISNTLKPFSVNLPSNVKKLVAFAFKGKNNGNTFSNAYRFHFRNFILNRVPRFDISADTVRIPSVVSLSCKYSNQEMLTLRITNHGFDPLDSTEAGFSINGNIPVKKKFGFNPPLAPGQSTVLVFSGNSGADLSNSEGTTITAFTNLPSENFAQRTNDTIRRTYGLIAPLATPTSVYQTYASMLGARWQRGRGASVPSGPISGWGNRATFTGQQTTGIDFGATANLMQDWFYSASYEGPSIVKMFFKAAVTGVGNTNPAASMNQDIVKLVYSIDCGASWTTARTFSQTDLTAGTLNNTLKEFSIELSNPRGAILVGFAAFRNPADPVANDFTFHLDSLSLGSPVFSDMLASDLIFGANGVVTCPSSVPVPLGVIIKNSGNAPITAATVGYKVTAGGFSKNVNFTPGLPVGGKDTVFFTGTEAPVFNTAGNHFVKGYINLAAEDASTRYNDSTASITYRLFPTVAVPYVEHFNQSGLLPVGWVSDTASGKGFKNTIGRGPGGVSALSYRAQPGFPVATLVTRNFGVITPETKWLGLYYRSMEQSGAFFRLRPQDYINVLVSIDCGTTYGFVDRIDSLNQEVAPGFRARDFHLDAYQGQDITVKLEAKLTPKSFSSSYLDIALFSIGASTVANSPMVNGVPVSFYPNPCRRTDGFSLTGMKNIKWVKAFSTDGKQFDVPFENVGDQHVRVQTGSLAAGLYQFRIVGVDGATTAKVLVQE